MDAAKQRRKPPAALVRATEPIARALAGRRVFPLWAVIHHRGRKSGKQYATPIAIVPTVDRTVLLIGLPWGQGTNWAQNVVAGHGATVTWKGADVPATNPRIVGSEVAVELAKGPFRRIVGGGSFPAFLVLDRPA